VPPKLSTLLLLALVPLPTSAQVPGRVAWSSDRQDGRHEIYTMRGDGGELRRLTFGGGKTPSWSPDGRWIAYYQPSDQTTHVMRSDGSADTSLCADGPGFDMMPLAFWRAGTPQLVCTRRLDGDLGYYATDPESGASQLLFRKSDFPRLQDYRFEPGGITRDGRWLSGWVIDLFVNGYTADNGTFTSPHSTVALDLNDRAKIYYIGPGCLSAVPPTGSLVYHVSRVGATMPDIFRLDLRDLASRETYEMEVGFPDADLGHEYMPSVSNDGAWLVYAASLGCHDWYACDYELFAHRLGAGTRDRVRLTFDPANDNFPSLFVETPLVDGRPIVSTDLGVRGDLRVGERGASAFGTASSTGCAVSGVPCGQGALDWVTWVVAMVVLSRVTRRPWSKGWTRDPSACQRPSRARQEPRARRPRPPLARRRTRTGPPARPAGPAVAPPRPRSPR
jgi:hypothetical protein